MRIRFLCTLLLILLLATPALCSQTDAPQEEAGPFSGNIADAVWTVIAFVVLLLVLRKLVWKQILAGLSSRAEHIEEQIRSADDTHKKAQTVLTEYQGKLAGVEEEGSRIITRRTKEAQRLADEVTDKAKAQADAIKAKAQVDIERAKSQAQDQLLVNAGDMVLNLGAEILGKTISAEDNQMLIDQAIERLKAQEKKNE